MAVSFPTDHRKIMQGKTAGSDGATCEVLQAVSAGSGGRDFVDSWTPQELEIQLKCSGRP